MHLLYARSVYETYISDKIIRQNRPHSKQRRRYLILLRPYQTSIFQSRSEGIFWGLSDILRGKWAANYLKQANSGVVDGIGLVYLSERRLPSAYTENSYDF